MFVYARGLQCSFFVTGTSEMIYFVLSFLVRNSMNKYMKCLFDGSQRYIYRSLLEMKVVFPNPELNRARSYFTIMNVFVFCFF